MRDCHVKSSQVPRWCSDWCVGCGCGAQMGWWCCVWFWAAERYVPTCEMGLRCICGVDDMTPCEVMEGCAVLGSHAPRNGNGGDTHRVAQASAHKRTQYSPRARARARIRRERRPRESRGARFAVHGARPRTTGATRHTRVVSRDVSERCTCRENKHVPQETHHAQLIFKAFPLTDGVAKHCPDFKALPVQRVKFSRRRALRARL